MTNKMSLKACWDMVNAAQDGRTPGEIRANCLKASESLRQNEAITNDDYDELMMAVAQIFREAGHMNG